ncbi:hypothetical protein SEUCBS139899_008705 [Sporothrix eucalyptigena]
MATLETTVTASGGAQSSNDTRSAPAARTKTSSTAILPEGQQRPSGHSDEILPDADDAQEPAEAEAGTNGAFIPTQSQSQPQQQQSPPPPPLPGPRATRLQTLFASSLDHTLAKVNWDNFAACYPTAAARAPQALRTVHKAMIDRLGELCTAEFAVVMRNRDVVRRLNELETLSVDAQKRRLAATQTEGQTTPPVAPHTLPAETVMAAHLAPQRKAQQQVLEERLAAVQSANAARFAQLTAQQAEAGQLVAALERALADAEGAAALLDEAATGNSSGGADGGDSTLVSELARETRAAEVEISEI